MRRLLTVLVMLTVLLVPAFAQAEQPISLFLDGVEIKSDVPPVLENGRTLVPVRALTEALGFSVNWDDATQTVTLTRGTQTIQLVIDKQEAIVDGKVVPLDVPPTVRNGRTIIPIRFVLEQVGLEVNWDEAKPAVLINQNPAAVRAAAIALIDKMNQGSFRAYGELEMTMGNAMISMKLPLKIQKYKKGQSEMLAYATLSIPGEEITMGQGWYRGKYWVQDQETGEWIPTSTRLLQKDIDSNPANMADLTSDNLAAATVSVTAESYDGVTMKVATVALADPAVVAQKMDDDVSVISRGSLVYKHWFNADGTPHHIDILLEADLANQDRVAAKIQGTLFYEVWNQPIPFPAEITGATN